MESYSWNQICKLLLFNIFYLIKLFLFQLNPIIPASTQNSTVMMSPDSQTHGISSSAPSPYPDNSQVSYNMIINQYYQITFYAIFNACMEIN